MRLPSEFLLFIFDIYGDSDQGNFGNRRRNEEYGISQSDFINEYLNEALEDAQKIVDSYDNNWLKDRLAQWHESLGKEIELKEQLMEQAGLLMAKVDLHPSNK